MIQRGVLVAVLMIAPVAIAHGLGLLMGEGSGGVWLALQVAGFALLLVLLRPRPLLAIVSGLVIFPVAYIALFLLGVSAGFYDYP
ncbi:MAG: hypothetical protein K2Y23_19195 [Cyanobacteria bacterium]|nr:hypothetical protein [Cyanobacteriota bacterium]